LGERLNGIQEVEGSTPFGSTYHSRRPGLLCAPATGGGLRAVIGL